ncbi:DNA-directed RNA polymerase III subunit C31 [Zalaria obscura]|uniref:DNA-directed RNA polymerase III subunit C31 n=1 Tax=Zalaria obscura TaxID=2024903 RepID=A0ACC3S562_9PEZI
MTLHVNNSRGNLRIGGIRASDFDVACESMGLARLPFPVPDRLQLHPAIIISLPNSVTSGLPSSTPQHVKPVTYTFKMSRGGRFGGGGGKNDMGKMGGQALPWEFDEELESRLSTKPSEKFPPMQPPIAEPPNEDEKRSVHFHRLIRDAKREGPFYADVDDNVRMRAEAGGPKAAGAIGKEAFFDPFNDQPTYTQRYKRKRRTVPDLSKFPFVKELFPKELWATIDPEDKSHLKKSIGSLNKRTRFDRLLAEGDEEEEGAEVDENEEEKEEDEANPEDKEGDEADPDQFDEDDEDDDDDYNAEQYFDDGEDDAGAGDDDYGGGGEDY